MTRGRKRTCFFVTPIGKEGAVTRKRSDWVLKYLLTPAIGNAYSITRADQIAEPGSITIQIIKTIADSDLVVADLTGLNANVIYELGVRHTLNRPAIQIMNQEEKLPFDLAGERTIFFKYDDVQSVDKAIKDLSQFVKEVERKTFRCTSPVSRSMEITNLLSSPRSIENEIGNILSEIISIRQQIDSIESEQMSMDFTLSSLDENVSEIKDLVREMSDSED